VIISFSRVTVQGFSFEFFGSEVFLLRLIYHKAERQLKKRPPGESPQAAWIKSNLN